MLIKSVKFTYHSQRDKHLFWNRAAG